MDRRYVEGFYNEILTDVDDHTIECINTGNGKTFFMVVSSEDNHSMMVGCDTQSTNTIGHETILDTENNEELSRVIKTIRWSINFTDIAAVDVAIKQLITIKERLINQQD